MRVRQHLPEIENQMENTNNVVKQFVAVKLFPFILLENKNNLSQLFNNPFNIKFT